MYCVSIFAVLTEPNLQLAWKRQFIDLKWLVSACLWDSLTWFLTPFLCIDHITFTSDRKIFRIQFTDQQLPDGVRMSPQYLGRSVDLCGQTRFPDHSPQDNSPQDNSHQDSSPHDNSPHDISPHGHFAPRTFRPTDISPHGRVVHGASGPGTSNTLPGSQLLYLKGQVIQKGLWGNSVCMYIYQKSRTYEIDIHPSLNIYVFFCRIRDIFCRIRDISWSECLCEFETVTQNFRINYG
jgi:hypothetical protein